MSLTVSPSAAGCKFAAYRRADRQPEPLHPD